MRRLGFTLIDRVGNKSTNGIKHMAIIMETWTYWNPNFLDTNVCIKILKGNHKPIISEDIF